MLQEQEQISIMTMHEQNYSMLMSIQRDLGTIMEKVKKLEESVDKIQSSLNENEKQHYLFNSISGWVKPSILVFFIFGLKWVGTTIWTMIANKPGV